MTPNCLSATLKTDTIRCVTSRAIEHDAGQAQQVRGEAPD